MLLPLRQFAAWNPLYHTLYDTFAHMDEHLDQGFYFHAATAAVWAQLTVQVADAQVGEKGDTKKLAASWMCVLYQKIIRWVVNKCHVMCVMYHETIGRMLNGVVLKSINDNKYSSNIFARWHIVGGECIIWGNKVTAWQTLL